MIRISTPAAAAYVTTGISCSTSASKSDISYSTVSTHSASRRECTSCLHSW